MKYTKKLFWLVPAFLLVAVGVLGAVKANAQPVNTNETLYGIVTAINGDAYTLALGEQTQTTAVASSRNVDENAPPHAENETVQATGLTPQVSSTQEAPSTQNVQSNAQTEPEPMQTREDMLFSDKGTAIVRTGVTTTLHLSDATQVVMRIGTAMVQTDVQRIAVGHVVKLDVAEDGSVAQVEILE